MKQPQKMQAMTRLFSPAVLALAFLCWSSAALATAGTPISDTPIGLEGDPGNIKVNTKTNANGNFNFSGLPPGKYKLCVADEPCKSVVVGKEGAVKGQVQKHDVKGTVTLLK